MDPLCGGSIDRSAVSTGVGSSCRGSIRWDGDGQNESGRKTSDLERLFGPKEGEIDTRISATAWRNYLEKNQASFSGETYWSSHLQDTDIIIGSNYDDGTVVFQWNEGVIGINGQPTICIDAKTSFRDGIQYYPTDAQAVGLNETEVTRLALYQ